MPDVKIWLDVVNLSDLGRLEESVCNSLTVVIFLSKGYFASKNVRVPPLLPSRTRVVSRAFFSGSAGASSGTAATKN